METAGNSARSEDQSINSVTITPYIRSYGILRVYLALLVSGNIQSNPGPLSKNPKCPRTVCEKGVIKSSKAASCDKCARWTHARCTGYITDKPFSQVVAKEDFVYICNECSLNYLPGNIIENIDDTHIFQEQWFTSENEDRQSTDTLDDEHLQCCKSKGLHFIH